MHILLIKVEGEGVGDKVKHDLSYTFTLVLFNLKILCKTVGTTRVFHQVHTKDLLDKGHMMCEQHK